MLYFPISFLISPWFSGYFTPWNVPCASKFDCDGWEAILILSNADVVLLKESVPFNSGDHFLILGRHKATLKKLSWAWSTVIGVAPQKWEKRLINAGYVPHKIKKGLDFASALNNIMFT